MKWVTRKPFHLLTKRQQYARIGIARATRLSQTQQTQNRQLTRSINILNNINFCDGSYNHDTLNTGSTTNCDLYISNNEKTIQEPPVDNDMNIHDDSKKKFKDVLRQCCLDLDFNHIQVTGLLGALRTHKCLEYLPKDSRTLLNTGRNSITLVSMGEGIYWHIGFLKTLKLHLALYNSLPDSLEIEISTDGLSLSRSNPSQYWPIQYRVLNIDGFAPIIAGIYKGPSKPIDPNIFFQRFVEEAKKSRNVVLVENCRISFMFKRFVADAPARSFILNHFGHNSKSPCSKCKVSGFRYENRVMVYLGINHAKRTDFEYTNEIDEGHQKDGKTPLTDLSINPVSGVPFDIMHLVYLGVTARFLNAWYLGKYGFGAKLRSSLLNQLSSRYEQLKHSCPNDFARRPRLLSLYTHFKATELRHFLLYASAVVLLGILPEKYYFHFLFLVIAMRILIFHEHSETNLQVAEKALKSFITHIPHLYTLSFMSYNVHSLQHLVGDAREFGPLETCSAFTYENNMPLFKKCLRNHPRPLQQFANRLREKNDIQHKPKNKIIENVSGIHEKGPVPENIVSNYTQYNKFHSNKFDIVIDKCNNYCKLTDESICKIENILKIEEKFFIVARKFKEVNNFFHKPIESSKVGVYKCKNFENLQLFSTNDIKLKCYCMPSWKASTSEINIDEYIISTLLHN